MANITSSPEHNLSAPPPVPPPVVCAPVAPPQPVECGEELLTQLRQFEDNEKARRAKHQAWFVVFTAMPGGLASLVVHLALLIVFGLLALIRPDLGGDALDIEVVISDGEYLEEVLEELPIEIEPSFSDMEAEPLEDVSFWEDQQNEAADDLVPEGVEDLLKTAVEDELATTPSVFTSGKPDATGRSGGSRGYVGITSQPTANRVDAWRDSAK